MHVRKMEKKTGIMNPVNVKKMKYITKDFQDDFVAQLQKAVHHIKMSREMEERYMLLEELMQEERAEGRAEGIAEGLSKGNQTIDRKSVV